MSNMQKFWEIIFTAIPIIIVAILFIGAVGSACIFFIRVWEFINQPLCTKFVLPEKGNVFSRALSEGEVKAISAWYLCDSSMLWIDIRKDLGKEGQLIAGGYFITGGWSPEHLLKHKDYIANFHTIYKGQ